MSFAYHLAAAPVNPLRKVPLPLRVRHALLASYALCLQRKTWVMATSMIESQVQPSATPIFLPITTIHTLQTIQRTKCAGYWNVCTMNSELECSKGELWIQLSQHTLTLVKETQESLSKKHADASLLNSINICTSLTRLTKWLNGVHIKFEFSSRCRDGVGFNLVSKLWKPRNCYHEKLQHFMVL